MKVIDTFVLHHPQSTGKRYQADLLAVGTPTTYEVRVLHGPRHAPTRSKCTHKFGTQVEARTKFDSLQRMKLAKGYEPFGQANPASPSSSPAPVDYHQEVGTFTLKDPRWGAIGELQAHVKGFRYRKIQKNTFEVHYHYLEDGCVLREFDSIDQAQHYLSSQFDAHKAAGHTTVVVPLTINGVQIASSAPTGLRLAAMLSNCNDGLNGAILRAVL